MIAAETDGGVDVILDNMGGAYLPRNVASLRIGGRLVVLGLQGGRRGELDLGALMTKRASVSAASLRARPAAQKAAIVTATERHVWPLIESGDVTPVIDRVIPLEEAAAAHRLVESSAHIGKVAPAGRPSSLIDDDSPTLRRMVLNSAQTGQTIGHGRPAGTGEAPQGAPNMAADIMLILGMIAFVLLGVGSVTRFFGPPALSWVAVPLVLAVTPALVTGDFRAGHRGQWPAGRPRYRWDAASAPRARHRPIRRRPAPS